MKPQDLAKLRKEWYAKAKASGFNDIEFVRQDGETLPFTKTGCRTDDSSILASRPLEASATSSYYSMAVEWLHVHVFESDLDRDVWTLHAEGQAMRAIAGAQGISLKATWKIVNRLQVLFDDWAETQELDDHVTNPAHEQNAAYYRLASLWTRSHTFESEDIRQQWKMHAEGKSYRKIGAALGVFYITVFRNVRKVRREFRAWVAEQRLDELLEAITETERPLAVKVEEVISDAEWNVIKKLMPPRIPGARHRPRLEDRPVVSALVWLARTGAPWRRLPKVFPAWQMVYQRLRLWRQDGTLEKILKSDEYLNSVVTTLNLRFGVKHSDEG